MKRLFLLLLPCLVVGFADAQKAGEPEEETVDLHPLAGAGKVAATDGNIPLMKALLEAGLPIDAPLCASGVKKDSPGWTALHLCCVHNQPAMMKFLLKHGAYRQHRDAAHLRPIDMAVEEHNEELCKLLAIPDTKDDMVGPVPREALAEILESEERGYKEPTFIAVNGTDPPKDMMFFLGAFGDKRRPASSHEDYGEGEKSGYRDKKTKERGQLVEFEIRPTKDQKPDTKSYSWSLRVRSGPFLAGEGNKGVVAKRYGYWVIIQQSVWEE